MRDAWPLAVASVKFPDSVVPVASASGKTRPLHLPARADLYLQDTPSLFPYKVFILVVYEM